MRNLNLFLLHSSRLLYISLPKYILTFISKCYYQKLNKNIIPYSMKIDTLNEEVDTSFFFNRYL